MGSYADMIKEIRNNLVILEVQLSEKEYGDFIEYEGRQVSKISIIQGQMLELRIRLKKLLEMENDS